MPDLWMDVDTALSEVPVNKVALIDDTDFKTREESVVYNQAGMDLVWNFVTTAGAYTQTAVTPTTAGDYDWSNQLNGMYSIEMPASAGASINNDTEGHGWFTGFATGILPWTGPIVGFRAAALNNALIDGGDILDVNTVEWLGTAAATPTTAGVPEVDVTFWNAILGVNDDYPSKQSQVSSLAATPGVGARPFVPTSITVTAGTNEAGSADDLANDDSLVYTVDDAAGIITLDFDYQLDPDTEVIQYLLVAAAQGNSDDIAFQIYNQVGASYDTFETIVGSNSLIYANLDKVIVQKYTSDVGLFQVRLTGTGLTSATLTVNKAVAYGVAASTGITNGSTVALSESAANQNYVGNNWILTLGGQNLNNMYAEGSAVSGTGLVTSGHAHFNHCEIGTVTIGPTHFDSCGFNGTWTMGTAGNFEMIGCHTETPAAGNITIDGNSLGSATSLVIQDFKGSITFVNLTSFHTMTISGTELGNIILGGADSTIKIRGIYESLTNNLTGSPTVTVEAIKASDLNTITGADGVTLATSQPNYAPNTVVPDNAGITDIQSRIPAALTAGGNMKSDILAIDGNTSLATRWKEYVDANVLFSDTAQAGGAATITLAAGTSQIDDDLHDFAIFINGGTGVGQFARINGVIAATQEATIVTPTNGWQTVPDNTSTYVILSAGSILHISEIHQAALTQISAEMDANSTQLAVIAEDTTTDIPALIAALNNISTADVLAQVNAALDAAIAELGVAAPTATPTLRTGLMLMYMMARNRVDVDTSGIDAMKVYNDAGTQIASKTITDDDTDYSEAKMS